MKNIVLTGFMGTGKTAVGRELSRILHMRIVDVDAEIEREQGMMISDIFSRFGEGRFREIETETIIRMAREESCIISTGGGAVLREENMEALRRSGMIFCLSARPETILARTSGSDERPLLRAGNPLEKINELLSCRRPYYQKAGMMIDTDDKTPLQVAEEIAEIYRCAS